MTVKTSVSLPDQQEAFARRMVEEGRYSSVSAVIQQGLELLRHETEKKDAELAALKALLDERSKGPFLSKEESRQQIEDLLAAKKKQYGL
ncbi:type II toxin-antitoxin system ParD family antitoxin [Gellertiella hungarica]|uniref:Antitoxin ParD1/3/4 n=1 Tax=Gellertiella hungarica TaxID=1572859 RepID=A0A7W6J1D4_9HYPH|nr:type II toxin-antitoxin system ParD family antitoxin [Gellertiella hungarica]MBB4062937.1 antitoxin ParD1/3/4 [Gellertiella hungarica]